MSRQYYHDSISRFLERESDHILGVLCAASEFPITQTQRDAWLAEIEVIKTALTAFLGRGSVYLEYSVPRLGRRIDVVLLIDHVLFILEFKIGADTFSAAAIEQVCDYALDMKNFHEPSHGIAIVPVLVATNAAGGNHQVLPHGGDGLYQPICSTPDLLQKTINDCLSTIAGERIAPETWEAGRYNPTPTIVEAAQALYANHGVAEISRSDAAATNLRATSDRIAAIINDAMEQRRKAICLLTGVPGAGKTLVGLNIAAAHTSVQMDLHSVYLSGNGPLVAVLREALARDKVRRERELQRTVRISAARSEVKQFIQNVHHFRDECLRDTRPPIEHVALFDEAQRAWNLEQTKRFMREKRKQTKFELSEPEFLISCMDRHQDWAAVVCLIGGGQEINTGEAGVGEWVNALLGRFINWDVYMSPRLCDADYLPRDMAEQLVQRPGAYMHEDLHLSVSMRSFRAENLSLLVQQLLDLDEGGARATHDSLASRYPIRISRDLAAAKQWIRRQARGTERYGLLASSRALRLKPEAVDIRTAVDPVQWFLNDRNDTRSSYYLEDAATEYKTQGLELDWACVAWDADFRRSGNHWESWSFRGEKWARIRKPERQRYQKNAYRVLLTRARQGMVIVVPRGNPDDHTRLPSYYDPIYEYLRRIGITEI